MTTKIKAFSLCCTYCDEVIKTTGTHVGNTDEDLNSVTGLVELNIIRRYFLIDATRSEVDQVLRLFNRRLPLCARCMEVVNRMYDFENEIERIKSLIDAMVAFLKGRLLDTLHGGSRGETEEKVLIIRRLMTGSSDKRSTVGQAFPSTLGADKEESLFKRIRTSLVKISQASNTNDIANIEGSSPVPTEAGDDKLQHGTKIKTEVKVEITPTPIQRPKRTRNLRPKYVASDDEAQDVDDPLSITPPGGHSPNVSGSGGDASNPDPENDEWTPGLHEPNDDYEAWDSDKDEASGTVKEEEREEVNVDEDVSESDDESIGLLPSDDEIDSSPEPPKKPKRNPCKTPPGEIPKWKQRKTDRKPRKTLKLGNDQFEFQGYRFSKTEQQTWRCDTCSSVLKARSGVVGHIKLTHLGEVDGHFLCPECGKNFTRHCGFNAHIAMHKNIKRFICDVCGKGFVQSGNLAEHKLRHEGEMSFVCEFEGCDKAFVTKKQLKNHSVRHAGERTHFCQVCGKSFFSRKALVEHGKCHRSPDKICVACKKSFKTNSHLNRHRRNVHLEFVE